MSALRLEIFLARLYSDAAACAAFLDDPQGEARRAGLAEADVERACAVDRAALALAARSFAKKRAHKRRRPWWRRLL